MVLGFGPQRFGVLRISGAVSRISSPSHNHGLEFRV